MPAMLKNHILVGRFGSPHGLDGEIRLSSFTSEPCAIASYKPLLDESGTREFTILRLRARKDNMFIAKISGICERASAEDLTNAPLYMPRESLPTTGEEEFYRADLIGLEALTPTGEPLGRILNVVNYGGGDILELAPQGGGATLLLPFNKEVFPHVDLESRRLTVVPPIEIEAR
jgi:16S rRNA processing protein RimM